MKKKILCFLLMLITVSTFCLKSNAQVYQTVIDDNLGRGIDLVKDDVNQASLKTNLVFDFDKLQKNVAEKKVSVGQGDVQSFCESSLKESQKKYFTLLNINNSDSNSKFFNCHISDMLNVKEELQNTILRKYFYENNYYCLYQTYLENPAENYGDNYSQSVSEDFKAAVNRAHLIKKKNSLNSEYIKIFEEFGTHILVKANYGASVELFSSIYSNEKSLETISNTIIERGIKSSIKGESISSNIENETIVESQEDFKNTENYFSVKYRGFNEANYTEWLNNKSSWINASNQESNSTLINTKNNEYVPIWTYLKWSNLENEIKNEFCEAYAEYVGKYASEIEENYTHISVISRGGYYKIHDSGEMSEKNNPEEFEFSGYTPSEKLLIMDLISKNSNDYEVNINVEFKYEHKEIDSGYQYIYVYSSLSSDAKLIAKSKDLPNSSKKNWVSGSFSFSVKPNDLEDLKFCIRYNAGGSGWDDWYIGEIELTISLEIKYIGSPNTD